MEHDFDAMTFEQFLALHTPLAVRAMRPFGHSWELFAEGCRAQREADEIEAAYYAAHPRPNIPPSYEGSRATHFLLASLGDLCVPIGSDWAAGI